MNMYITVGTYNFLKTLKQNYPQEKMVLIENENGALLLHETRSETVFKEPRKYEVLNEAGSFENHGFFVFNHIPVTDEGRPIFEYRLLNRPKQIENEPGFLALKVLRPLKSNTYLILTVWESEDAFNNCKNSSSFKDVYSSKTEIQKSIFASVPYVTKYTFSE